MYPLILLLLGVASFVMSSDHPESPPIASPTPLTFSPMPSLQEQGSRSATPFSPLTFENMRPRSTDAQPSAINVLTLALHMYRRIESLDHNYRELERRYIELLESNIELRRTYRQLKRQVQIIRSNQTSRSSQRRRRNTDNPESAPVVIRRRIDTSVNRNQSESSSSGRESSAN